MQVERYEPRKKTNPLLMACGCLFGGLLLASAGVLVGLIFFGPQLLQFVAGFAGIEVVGDVDAVLNTTVQAVPQLENPQEVENVVINAGDFSQTLEDTGAGYEVVVGEVDETTQLQISFDESALLAQCRQLTPVCSDGNPQIRNASFDLKPNAVILRGEFQLGETAQEAGLVMLVQNENQLSILGLEVFGSIIASDNPEFNATLQDAGSQINNLLQSLTAQAGGESYTLSSIIADENTLTLIMR